MARKKVAEDMFAEAEAEAVEAEAVEHRLKKVKEPVLPEYDTIELPYDITNLNDEVILYTGDVVEVLGKSENEIETMYRIQHNLLKEETWVKIPKEVKPKPMFDDFEILDLLESDPMVNPYHIKLIATGLGLKYSGGVNKGDASGWYNVGELLIFLSREERISHDKSTIILKALEKEKELESAAPKKVDIGFGNIIQELAERSPSLFAEPAKATTSPEIKTSPVQYSEYELEKLRVKYEVKYSMKYKYKYMYKKGV